MGPQLSMAAAATPWTETARTTTHISHSFNNRRMNEV
jgi:hypothetical protein